MIPRPSDHQSTIAIIAMLSEGIPGVSGVIVRSGETITGESYGYRNLNEELPMTSETVTPMFSIAKSMAETAIVQLVGTGDDLLLAAYQKGVHIADFVPYKIRQCPLTTRPVGGLQF